MFNTYYEICYIQIYINQYLFQATIDGQRQPWRINSRKLNQGDFRSVQVYMYVYRYILVDYQQWIYLPWGKLLLYYLLQLLGTKGTRQQPSCIQGFATAYSRYVQGMQSPLIELQRATDYKRRMMVAWARAGATTAQVHTGIAAEPMCRPTLLPPHWLAGRSAKLKQDRSVTGNAAQP